MPDDYYLLEKYFRSLPTSDEEVTLTFERIEQILRVRLPRAAREEEPWWGNQKPGTQVESLAWMDAGWMVEIVNLPEEWVRFVRQ
jgi:hypothetical protein